MEELVLNVLGQLMELELTIFVQANAQEAVQNALGQGQTNAYNALLVTINYHQEVAVHVLLVSLGTGLTLYARPVTQAV
jgi:hypothetical protein